MHINDILTLYDKEIRQEAKIYKGRREVMPELVRQIFDDPKRNCFISYYNLPEGEARAIIEREIAYFQSLERNLEWSTFAHNNPPNLHLLLAEYGFEIEEELESIMVLDLNAPPALLVETPAADVRLICDAAGIDDVIRVEESVWDRDYSWLREKLTEDLRERPDELSVYAVYVDGKPVSSGWVYFHPKTHFASLWGGSTLASYRKQGLYTALVAVRVQEAIRRGFRFMTIDAGSMSRPIVARLGFQLLTTAYECNLKYVNGKQ